MNKKSGFIQFNIGGKKRPMKFGTNASALYCEKREVTLADMQDELSEDRLINLKMTGTEIRDLIWSGLVAGARSKGIDEEPTPHQVGDWLDEVDHSELQHVFEAVNGQTKDLKKAAEQKTPKKK